VSLAFHLEFHHLVNSQYVTAEDEARLTQVVSDEIECLGVIGHFSVQPSQVKPIKNKVLVDFAEVFVTLSRQKP
jgi:hypothetical protein